MCALFGWLDYKGIVPYNILKKLTQALANAAEERGTDASGIAYIHNGDMKIFKRPKPAHKIHFNAPDGTRAVMGHTRMTTQGNEKHNFNNHPFHGHADVEFAFAHNGMIHNDEKLRKEKQLPDTHIETDSYIAVQLIEQQNKLDFNSLKNMAEDVSGSFCFTLLDISGKMYFVKGSNPMNILHFESLGLYIYASTESILKKALKKIGFGKFFSTAVKITEGDIISIDSNGNIECADFDPYKNQPLNRFSFHSWFDDYDDFSSGYHTMYEEMLLDMCGMYGVDSEDVEMLLEYGYSAEEIEEMLDEPSILEDIINSIKGADECSDCLAFI